MKRHQVYLSRPMSLVSPGGAPSARAPGTQSAELTEPWHSFCRSRTSRPSRHVLARAAVMNCHCFQPGTSSGSPRSSSCLLTRWSCRFRCFPEAVLRELSRPSPRAGVGESGGRSTRRRYTHCPVSNWRSNRRLGAPTASMRTVSPRGLVRL